MYLRTLWTESHGYYVSRYPGVTTSHAPTNTKQDSHTHTHHFICSTKLPNIGTVFGVTVHDVFHASLLSTYCETAEHRPNFINPPPEEIDGEEEYEVANILSHRGSPG